MAGSSSVGEEVHDHHHATDLLPYLLLSPSRANDDTLDVTLTT